MREPSLVLSAEHAGRDLPRRWAALFAGSESLLSSHRGHDIGSLELAEALRRETGAPLFATTITRLLVDCNRSVGAKGLFSELTRRLPESERRLILERFHGPHRRAVEAGVEETLNSQGTVLHVGVHSFTPVWKGRTRDVDVGLLFDPRRPREAELARRWRSELARLEPGLLIRLNRPYRGWTDGLTTCLRKRWPDSCYAGIELELNQLHSSGRPGRFRELQRSLSRSLLAILG